MLPDVLQHTLNGLKSNILQGSFYKAKQEQQRDVKSSVAGVSAFGMPCSCFLQEMVLPLNFSPLFHCLTPHPKHSPDSSTPLHQAICCGPNAPLGHRSSPLGMPMGYGCPFLGI